MESQGYQNLINNLRAAIDALGMKHKTFAARCNMTVQQLSNILCFRKRITVEELLAFCVALDVTPNDLYFGNDEARPA